MPDLVKPQAPSSQLIEPVASIASIEVVEARPPLVAALWLYIDELDRSHQIIQSLEDPIGSFWHGIMYRREGDFSNSHYWFRRVGEHPAMSLFSEGQYDAHALIDKVESAHQAGQKPAAILETQRQEWQVLFAWCAIQ